MKTSKPCSTISYNSRDYLVTKLNDLLKRRVISFWCFIHHLPEEDEKKPHKHLFVVPNGQINTDQVQDYLQELNPSDIEHPFGCIFFKSSKWDDFYFYGLHDPVYLATKGQTRKYTYQEVEFVTSDLDYFTALKHEIDYSKVGNAKTIQIVNEIKSGATLTTLLETGKISAQNALQWKTIYDMFHGISNTYRNGSLGHDSFVDIETGEVDYDPELAIAFDVALSNKMDERKRRASKPKGTK